MSVMQQGMSSTCKAKDLLLGFATGCPQLAKQMIYRLCQEAEALYFVCASFWSRAKIVSQELARSLKELQGACKEVACVGAFFPAKPTFFASTHVENIAL
jgi:hypothetical protein